MNKCAYPRTAVLFKGKRQIFKTGRQRNQIAARSRRALFYTAALFSLKYPGISAAVRHIRNAKPPFSAARDFCPECPLVAVISGPRYAGYFLGCGRSTNALWTCHSSKTHSALLKLSSRFNRLSRKSSRR